MACTDQEFVRMIKSNLSFFKMGDGFVTSLENTFRTHSHGDFSLHPILGQHPIYNPHSLSEAPSLCLNLFRSLILCFAYLIPSHTRTQVLLLGRKFVVHIMQLLKQIKQCFYILMHLDKKKISI